MWSELLQGEREKIGRRICRSPQAILPFAGFCPVRERLGKRVKYYMIFASRILMLYY